MKESDFLKLAEAQFMPTNRKLKVHRFLGIALAGGKTNKTTVALLEYYPEQNKSFLVRIFDKLQTEGEVSSDARVHKLIDQIPGPLENLAFDVPLKLPKCIRCRLDCPGYEECTEDEIEWMWKVYRKKNEEKKPRKLFTPYTERCAELYISTQLEEKFHPPHALGSNMAPLTARAHFISRRLNTNTMEVYPKLSLWRIGTSLNIQKSHLRHHKNAVTGIESRSAILKALVEKNIVFVYEQDLKILTDSHHAFEAFLCALTAVLKFKGQCEAPPKGFPESESWIDFPKVKIEW